MILSLGLEELEDLSQSQKYSGLEKEYRLSRETGRERPRQREVHKSKDL